MPKSETGCVIASSISDLTSGHERVPPTHCWRLQTDIQAHQPGSRAQTTIPTTEPAHRPSLAHATPPQELLSRASRDLSRHPVPLEKICSLARFFLISPCTRRAHVTFSLSERFELLFQSIIGPMAGGLIAVGSSRRPHRLCPIFYSEQKADVGVRSVLPQTAFCGLKFRARYPTDLHSIRASVVERRRPLNAIVRLSEVLNNSEDNREQLASVSASVHLPSRFAGSRSAQLGEQRLRS